MKRKLIAMLLALSMVSLVSCGSNDSTEQKETPTEQEQEVVDDTNETDDIEENEESEEPEIQIEEKTIVFEDTYSKFSHSSDSVEIVLDASVYSWNCDVETPGIIDMETANDENYLNLTVLPTSEGSTLCTITGLTDTDNWTYYVKFNVDSESSLDIIVSLEPITDEVDEPVIDEPIVEDPIVSDVNEELNAMITLTYDTLGADNYPNSVVSRALEIDNVDDMTYILGTDTLAGLEDAVVSEPLMSSIAFSYVVLQFDTLENATLAADILLNSAPTTKWVCVEPETTITKVVDNKVLFFMGPVATADVIKTLEF